MEESTGAQVTEQSQKVLYASQNRDHTPVGRRRRLVSPSYGSFSDFAVFFGNLLLDSTGAMHWPREEVIQRSSVIDIDQLIKHLEIYAPGLPWNPEGDPMEFTKAQHWLNGHALSKLHGVVKNYSGEISRYFYFKAIFVKSPPPSRSSTPELTALFRRVLSGNRTEHLLDNEEEDCKQSETERMESLILNDADFVDLVVSIRQEFFFGPTSKARPAIISYITANHINLPWEVMLKTDWKPLTFLKMQFGSPRHMPRIGSLLSLTGTSLYAQVTSCEKYVEQTWDDGKELLSALQRFLDGEYELLGAESPGQSQEREPKIYNISAGSIRFHLSADETLSATVFGEKDTIIDVTDQISWLSAVMSTSPSSQGESTYCKTSLRLYSESKSSPATVLITRIFEPIPFSGNTVCWLRLLPNRVLAYGFPIPERFNEFGLEGSLDVMAALTGARHAVEYEGGVVVKGFSTMLVPMKRSKTAMGDAIQWHLVYSKEEEKRLSYREGLNQCRHRALVNKVDLTSLKSTRTFVGWSSSVEQLLGKADANYENVDYSGAADATNRLKLHGGSLGFQQFALAQVDFTLGVKDGKCHFQRKGPYRRLIDASEKTPILLFDTGERRAWLVPASGVMMHIAQHRNWLEPYISEKGKVAFKDEASFKDALLSNGPSDLSCDEEYQFKDLVTGVWSILEFLLDQSAIPDRDAGLDVLSPFRYTLEGYEFKSVVEERSPMRRKTCKVKHTAGQWPSLIKDIDALVLFANGFGDLIKPSSADVGICHMWRTVPKEKDYLTTTVKMVNDLYDYAGCRLSREYLTSSQLQWHRGDSVLFDHCKDPGSYKCECNRVQEIVQRGLTNTLVRPPGHLQEQGAIIFGKQEPPSICAGRARTSRITSAAAFSAQKSTGSGLLYSQPNVVLDLNPLLTHPQSPSASSISSYGASSLSISSSNSASTSRNIKMIGDTSPYPSVSDCQDEDLSHLANNLQLTLDEYISAAPLSTRGSSTLANIDGRNRDTGHRLPRRANQTL